MMGVTMEVEPGTANQLLLAAAKRQDEGAVVAFIEECQRQIVAAIEIAGVRRYSSDFDDAQNLALFEIWKEFPNLRSDSAVWAWMHGIARRITTSRVIAPAARQRRRDQKHRDHTPFDGLELTGPGQRVAEQDRLTRVLDELSEEHREILLMRYVLGYSEAECAEQFDVAVKTISSRTVRAKRAALTAIKNMEDER